MGATLDNGPIAIVGLSGRYPESIDVDAYWRNLRDGKDCITEVPRAALGAGASTTPRIAREAAAITTASGAVSSTVSMSSIPCSSASRHVDARPSMDPQERLFLQHSWMAIEDAGYTRAALQVPHYTRAARPGRRLRRRDVRRIQRLSEQPGRHRQSRFIA